jgi:hypothetical protein
MADAFIYQGNILCKSCARDLKKVLREKNVEDTGDSGDWPQGPYPDGGGEADSPTHCGNGKDCLESLDIGSGIPIGVWLENPLTEKGLKFVAERLAENFNSPRRHGRLVNNYWRCVYHDELMQWLAGRLIKLTTTTDPDKVHEFIDCDYAYTVDLSGNLKGTHNMCRWELSEDGHLKHPRVIVVPEEAMKGVAPEKMLRDAIDEGAFE